MVDDKPYIRQLVATVLKLRGYEVLEAGNGQEGLSLARQELPGLIILDLLMPGMDGYQMILSIRTDPFLRRIPVIVMSAKADSSGVAPVPWIQDYLMKPFDIDELEELVDRYYGMEVTTDLTDPAGADAAGSAAGEAAATGP